MTDYYWMNKEHGYLVTEGVLYEDADAMGYEDITDPTSVEYLNYSIYYTKTNIIVK